MLPESGRGSTPIDTSKPHPARMYDYYLGGKDHYPVDAEAAEQVLGHTPDARTFARANRLFMHRTVRVLARDHGVRQFLDIGTGVPTEPNLHQIAQAEAPECRVVYADNDPIVLAHARALLHGTPEGRVAYLQADVREPKAVLESDETRTTLDFDQPIALSLCALMHFVPDEHGAYEIVRELIEALPSGSFLTLSHGTTDFDPEGMARTQDVYVRAGIPIQLRSGTRIARFFDGLELLPPGLAVTHRWHPEPDQPLAGITDAQAGFYGGVARKP
ncbi:SAM-dependent methyltransferase [Streptomyces rhizosphaerihabitans]|uniref:SAM-dependent methyltransferase n=1 Tax=Streptomyces rhizosphaerihabitans TaxID=1266770 RepID=UPI0021C21C68|nr:SAM-dependent methyltransferase [Streptomyces rhizosphaerihabitans]MCT9006866.1 SAM-dependent methyltransferase [Streptomyces rhizosphaerihabitans]